MGSVLMAFFLSVQALRKQAKGFAVTPKEQLKMAYAQCDSRRQRITRQRAFEVELDEQLERAMGLWGARLSGVDPYKELADRITSDEAHPVSVTTVYDCFSRRNGRRPSAEAIAVVYEEVPEFAVWWNQRHGYTLPEKLTQLTWEEERKLLRRALAEFGTVGEQKLRVIASAKPETP